MFLFSHWICFLPLGLQGEMVQWTVFLISFWGDQIGQKVKKICDWWGNLCIYQIIYLISS